MKKRKVYLIGAGPGKRDLITVRGANVLAQAEVVVYDYLVDKGLLNYAPKDAEMICCGKLARKGKYSYGHPVDQGIIDKIILEKVNQNKKVVRLKNGDPAFFSRFSEELKALLKSGIEFEVVPGVTAAGAASSLCGIPLTDRDHASSCVFAAGHKSRSREKASNNWDALSNGSTLVIYMGVGNLKKIVKKILESGKSKETPVAIIKDISLVTQKLFRGTLGNIVQVAEKSKLKPPAVVIIGDVAKFEKQFNWLRKNKRILFTGLSAERFFDKGTFDHLPLISIEPAKDYVKFDRYIRRITDFDWIVFTSRYGVKYFFKRLESLGYDARKLSNIKIAAIGKSTKRKLADYAINADLVPKKELSLGLIEEFKAIDLKGKKIFLPRSDISDKGLEKALKEMGADIVAAIAYRNVVPEDLPDLDINDFDEIMFTSPSTVRNFKQRYGRVPKNVRLRCIGDVTLREAKKCNLLN